MVRRAECGRTDRLSTCRGGLVGCVRPDGSSGGPTRTESRHANTICSNTFCATATRAGRHPGAVVLLSQVFYFISLDLPKRIVNEPSRARGSSRRTRPQTFLAIRVPTLGLLDKPFTLFDGLQLDRIDYLVALSLAFLVFVLVNGWFKLRINTEKGRSASACCGGCASTSSTASCCSRQPFPQGQAGRARHHDQGRGGAARRLHRRRLRAAGLPRRPGADGARLHPGAEPVAGLVAVAILAIQWRSSPSSG